MSAQNPGRILVNRARLRFPKLDKPEQFQGEGEYAYTAAFIIPKDHPQLAEIRAEMDVVAKAKWPKEWASIMKSANAKDGNALHDGDVKASVEGYEGNFYISGRNSGKDGKMPSLKPSLMLPNRTEIQDMGPMYDGCYVNVQLEFWAQDNGYGKKINAQIRGVQFAGNGDAFSASGGSRAKADEFEDVTESAGADDFA